MTKLICVWFNFHGIDGNYTTNPVIGIIDNAIFDFFGDTRNPTDWIDFIAFVYTNFYRTCPVVVVSFGDGIIRLAKTILLIIIAIELLFCLFVLPILPIFNMVAIVSARRWFITTSQETINVIIEFFLDFESLLGSTLTWLSMRVCASNNDAFTTRTHNTHEFIPESITFVVLCEMDILRACELFCDFSK